MCETDFETMIDGLLRPAAYPHAATAIERIETHISVVLLAGDFAYKIKKPVDLGFVDFSTLARRRGFCDEEMRLNRRLAPDYYLAVVAITGSPSAPHLDGDGAAIEYAVKMRRFPQDALLSRQIVTPTLIDRLAERVATFHEQIPAAGEDADYGSHSAVLDPMLDNFSQIRPRLAAAGRDRIERLATWTRARAEALRTEIARRRREGRVRECHGDMHRGNIAIVDDEIVIFDAIEFNARLRWIDTISEVAFLAMDLDESGHDVLAQRFLNRYLQIGGDYDGLPLLNLYKVYRALVRAKVIAIRLGQGHIEPAEAAAEQRDLDRYLRLAEGYTRQRRPSLILMHGLSGSGKSWLATRLLEHLDAIHLRSDIERKRLFGLSADADSTGIGNIYTPETTLRTYDRLRQRARTILRAGYHALVDAAFLRQGQREGFLDLAEQLGCPCHILSTDAPEAVLQERLSSRRTAGHDPSEADSRVLDLQLRSQEPLTARERGLATFIDTTAPIDLALLSARLLSSNCDAFRH
jgi:aminoglycoside phosphotransferase family enzyme